MSFQLTQCGLMTPYGGRDPFQHWFRYWLVAWRHLAITWTNVDLPSLRSGDVHVRAISLETSQPSFTKICLKIISLRFYWNFPGANELTERQFPKLNLQPVLWREKWFDWDDSKKNICTYTIPSFFWHIHPFCKSCISTRDPVVVYDSPEDKGIH